LPLLKFQPSYVAWLVEDRYAETHYFNLYVATHVYMDREEQICAYVAVCTCMFVGGVYLFIQGTV